MIDRTAGKGASAMIRCESCRQQRPMNEAQGQAGAAKLPKCRGRHPHLDAFQENGCGRDTKLMLIGASNLWFPATQSIIVMPESVEEKASDLADRIRVALGARLAAVPFGHGASHQIGKLRLLDRYHCSRYNTNTGVLTPEMFRAVFAMARERL